MIILTRTAERMMVHIQMTLPATNRHRRITALEIVESVEETSSNKAPMKLAVAVLKAHNGNFSWMKSVTGM